jgi:hypothetical protein
MSKREAEYCRKVGGAGIQHFIVGMPEDYELKPLELMRKESFPQSSSFGRHCCLQRPFLARLGYFRP